MPGLSYLACDVFAPSHLANIARSMQDGQYQPILTNEMNLCVIGFTSIGMFAHVLFCIVVY